MLHGRTIDAKQEAQLELTKCLNFEVKTSLWKIGVQELY